MKDKKRVKQISILLGIVAVSGLLLFATAITSEEALASGGEVGVFAGCFVECVTCVIAIPTICSVSCAACLCDECVYYIVSYARSLIYNRKKDKDINGKRNGKPKPREDWIVIENGVPAIIDKDVFNAVQIKMKQNRENGGRHKAKEVYVLSGLVFCGECGALYYGNSRSCGRHKVPYVSYKCSNRGNRQGCRNKELRKDYLENFVLDALYTNLFNAASIKKLSALLAEYHRKQDENNRKELEIATAEFNAVIEKINAIVTLVADAGISPETVRENLRELEEKKQYLERYIRELTLHQREARITEDVISGLILQSREFVKTKNLAECRSFIKNYVNKVMVHGDTVEVIFNVSVPNEAADGVEPLTSAVGIKAIQREYKAATV